MARLAPEVKMALKAQRAVAVPMEILGPWAPLGRRANLESQAYLGTQEDKGQRAPLDSRDSLVPMERRVAGGHLESPDHGDSEAQRGRGVREVRGASRGSLAPRVTLEVMAQPALPVSGDPMDPKDPRAFLDQRVPRVPQARMGSLDTLGSEERLASKARLDPQDPQVWLDLRVLREKRVRWANVATLGLPGLLVNRDSQALPAKRAQRVTQARLASLERMGPQAYVASLGTEGSRAQWEPLG